MVNLLCFERIVLRKSFWVILFFLMLNVLSQSGSVQEPTATEVQRLLNETELVDFVVIETLNNDEKQIFTQNGSTWSQILTLSNSTDPGVSLIISANEHIVVKSIYRIDGQLLDCDVLNGDEPAKYLDIFQSEITRVINQGNCEFHQLDELNYTMTATQLQSLLVQQQKDRCLELHKSVLEANKKSSVRQRRHRNYNGTHHRLRHGGRSRRYIYFPGTFWCGAGTKASSAAHFGEDVEADHCCRQHDQCPMTIGGLSRQFQLFNHRLHTISLCDCDKQFYDCLKNAGSGKSYWVGKTYFNYMGTPCFTLSLEYVCTDYSWWGTCKAKETKWIAKLNSTDWF